MSRAGRPPCVVELRGVPRRHRAWREDWSRADPARVAGGADVRVEVVADRVALPVQREIPAGLGTAFPLLPRDSRPAAHRGGGARGGGIRRPAARAQASLGTSLTFVGRSAVAFGR